MVSIRWLIKVGWKIYTSQRRKKDEWSDATAALSDLLIPPQSGGRRKEQHWYAGTGFPFTPLLISKGAYLENACSRNNVILNHHSSHLMYLLLSHLVINDVGVSIVRCWGGQTCIKLSSLFAFIPLIYVRCCSLLICSLQIKFFYNYQAYTLYLTIQHFWK